MATIIDGEVQVDSTKGTFALLDDIVTILGSTRMVFWPFTEWDGIINNRVYGNNANATNLQYQTTDSSTNTALSSTANTSTSPFLHSGGVYSYMMESSNDIAISTGHQAHLSVASSGGVDAVASWGIWIMPVDVTTVTLISKWDETVTEDREYRLGIDGSSNAFLQLYDDTNNDYQTSTGGTTVSTAQWTFICATYDGSGGSTAADGIQVYLNSVAETMTADYGSDGYADIVVGSTAFNIGSDINSSTNPANEFTGRIALPFMTGKELSAGEVGSIYRTGKQLLGV